MVQGILWRGEESLEDEECSDQPSESDNDQLIAIIEADPLTTTWEDAEELNMNHSTVIWPLKQIGKMKKIDKWVDSGDDHKSKKSSFWNVFS